MIVCVGLSHDTAPIGVRERLAIASDGMESFLQGLRTDLALPEVFVLSTCNRVEIYAWVGNDQAWVEAEPAHPITAMLLDRAGEELRAVLPQYLFQYAGDAAIRHMFRVAASLDSLVLGEAQILGQFKDAYEAAQRAGTLGTVLGRAVEWAIRTAKRTRSETQVGSGAISISSVAVLLARQILGDLDRRVAVLLGAGEMAEAAATHLVDAGARLRVVNRSLDRALLLAEQFKGEGIAWSGLDGALEDADVVISSTSSVTHVLSVPMIEDLMRRRRGRSLFVIDIAVPRDVDPQVNALDGVYLYDIDDLSKIAAQTRRERYEEARRAESIVNDEADAFDAWLESLAVTPTIVSFRQSLDAILRRELDKSLAARLRHLSPQDQEALHTMVSAAVKKIAHSSSVRLKAAAAEGSARPLVEAIRYLFALDETDSSSDSLHPARVSSLPPSFRAHSPANEDPS